MTFDPAAAQALRRIANQLERIADAAEARAADTKPSAAINSLLQSLVDNGLVSKKEDE